MPTNPEKRPRWLMVCKCGATVKASAWGAEINAFARSAPGRRAVCARIWQELCPRRQTPRQAASGTRNDRGSLEGRYLGFLKGVPITLEQHAPLERTRAHDGKPGHDVFPHSPEIGRHQCHLCQCVWKRARFGNGLVEKH